MPAATARGIDLDDLSRHGCSRSAPASKAATAPGKLIHLTNARVNLAHAIAKAWTIPPFLPKPRAPNPKSPAFGRLRKPTTRCASQRHRSKGWNFPVVIFPTGKRSPARLHGAILVDREAFLAVGRRRGAAHRYPSLAHTIVQNAIRRQTSRRTVVSLRRDDACQEH